MCLDSFLTIMSVCLLIAIWQTNTFLLVNALYVGIKLVNPRVDFMLSFGSSPLFQKG